MVACGEMRAIRAVAVGMVVAIVLFLLIAAMATLGGKHLAGEVAEFSLLATLLAIASVITLGRPVQMRKARVPIRRAMPPAWWPQETEETGLLALCLGGPIVVASAAGAFLFR